MKKFLEEVCIHEDQAVIKDEIYNYLKRDILIFCIQCLIPEFRLLEFSHSHTQRYKVLITILYVQSLERVINLIYPDLNVTLVAEATRSGR